MPEINILAIQFRPIFESSLINECFVENVKIYNIDYLFLGQKTFSFTFGTFFPNFQIR